MATTRRSRPFRSYLVATLNSEVTSLQELLGGHLKLGGGPPYEVAATLPSRESPAQSDRRSRSLLPHHHHSAGSSDRNGPIAGDTGPPVPRSHLPPRHQLLATSIRGSPASIGQGSIRPAKPARGADGVSPPAPICYIITWKY